MNNRHMENRQYGLTLSQWIILFVAFMLGVGGTFIVREIFLPEAVYAASAQTATVRSAQSGQTSQTGLQPTDQSVRYYSIAN